MLLISLHKFYSTLFGKKNDEKYKIILFEENIMKLNVLLLMLQMNVKLNVACLRHLTTICI